MLNDSEVSQAGPDCLSGKGALEIGEELLSGRDTNGKWNVLRVRQREEVSHSSAHTECLEYDDLWICKWQNLVFRRDFLSSLFKV
jgi:hypothetical protein